MRIGRNLVLFAVAAAASFMPAVAWAQIVTAGDAAQNVANESVSLSDILSTTSYVLGIACGFLGIRKLVSWNEGQAPVSEGLMRLAGAAGLVAGPWFVNTLENTIFSGFGGTMAVRDATSTLPTGTGPGLDTMMINFVKDVYAPAKALISVVGYVLGIGCIVNGIYRFARAGQGAQGRAPSMNGTVGYMVGGALLVALAETMDLITNTLFGVGVGDAIFTFTTLAYVPPGISTGSAVAVFQALFAFVEIVGWIGFARGVYLLIKLAQGDGGRTHLHAFTHIIAGAMAVNMVGIIKLVQSSLGTTFIT